MTSAQDAGVVTGDPANFATNVLVLVTPPDNPAHITSLADLDGATWVRCADEAPCGKVALAVLDAQHVTAQPASLEDDARSTLDKVTSGEADAALVYASDAQSAGDSVKTIAIPGAEEQQTSYFVAPLDQSGDADLAQQFVDLVTGPDGQQALADAGFGKP
jgi:molybdate transport system substrate-binding protein